MSQSRLSFSLLEGGLTLPPEGRITVFAPPIGADLSDLPAARVDIVHFGAAESAFWTGRGFQCSLEPHASAALSIVFLPRARALAEGLIAVASATARRVVVDGAKTDGVESLLKAVKSRLPVQGQVSKAHGKCFWFEASDVFADWHPGSPTANRDGYVTSAGVFSSDGIDPASAALAASLPGKLGAQVGDLGAGWGYLSAHILDRGAPEAVHLVENDHRALDCARRNVVDDRAVFHWADALTWNAPVRLDSVVMNPPFHAGRKADPEIGRAFIRTAARLLKPAGQLWLVANRHLPYETTLGEAFAQTDEVAGDTRFKILHAQRPKRGRT